MLQAGELGERQDQPRCGRHTQACRDETGHGADVACLDGDPGPGSGFGECSVEVLADAGRSVEGDERFSRQF